MESAREEVSKLVELTEQFINYLAILYVEGRITEEQYTLLIGRKKEFLNKQQSQKMLS